MTNQEKMQKVHSIAIRAFLLASRKDLTWKLRHSDYLLKKAIDDPDSLTETQLNSILEKYKNAER